MLIFATDINDSEGVTKCTYSNRKACHSKPFLLIL